MARSGECDRRHSSTSLFPATRRLHMQCSILHAGRETRIMQRSLTEVDHPTLSMTNLRAFRKFKTPSHFRENKGES